MIICCYNNTVQRYSMLAPCRHVAGRLFNISFLPFSFPRFLLTLNEKQFSARRKKKEKEKLHSIKIKGTTVGQHFTSTVHPYVMNSKQFECIPFAEYIAFYLSGFFIFHLSSRSALVQDMATNVFLVFHRTHTLRIDQNQNGATLKTSPPTPD